MLATSHATVLKTNLFWFKLVRHADPTNNGAKYNKMLAWKTPRRKITRAKNNKLNNCKGILIQPDLKLV